MLPDPNETRQRRRIDNREFVVTWMNSESTQAVANALDITPKQAAQRASHLRRLGVKLPKMRRAVVDNHLEVAQLNSLIKKHSK